MAGALPIFCDRCTMEPAVISSDTFCPECANKGLCVECFALHVAEMIDEIEPPTHMAFQIWSNRQ